MRLGYVWERHALGLSLGIGILGVTAVLVYTRTQNRKMFWCEAVMLLLEFLAAMCAVAVCGPCLLACARRLIIGDELLQRQGGGGVHEAAVQGCDEPACPYYKHNVRYLMLPARRRLYNSPTRH